MRAYYSAHTLYNLVSWPVTSLFTGRMSVVGEPLTDSFVHRHHYFGPPIYQGIGYNRCLSSPLLACNNDLDPTTLKRKLRWHRHLRTTTQVQWRGRRSTFLSRTQHRCRRTPKHATRQRPESDQPADRAAAARNLPERSVSRPLCPVAGQKCPGVCQGCE